MSAGAAGLPAAGAGASPAADDGRIASSAHRWVFLLTVACLWTAALLRSVLAFDGRQRIMVVALLALWLAAAGLGELAVRRRPAAFPLSLIVQVALVVFLLTQSDGSDYFAVLLAVATMQAMACWRPRSVAMLIAVLAALTGLGLADEYSWAGALPMVAVYGATEVFFAAYAYAAARSAAARARSEALAADLRETNRRLAESAERSERLGAERERQQLARDLHDSVTQTLFSMNLTAQSALLLLRREPREVEAQLDQIDELARAAREELVGLRAGTRSTEAAGGLAAALRRHCEERRQRDGLEVALEVDGDEALPADEERALLRIVQEGLNNVVKHAGVSRAAVRLRLRRPFRLEVEDEGKGFDPEVAAAFGGGMGLVGMRERAGEHGWSLTVTSAPGEGTRVVVDEADAGVDAAASEGGRGRGGA